LWPASSTHASGSGGGPCGLGWPVSCEWLEAERRLRGCIFRRILWRGIRGPRRGVVGAGSGEGGREADVGGCVVPGHQLPSGPGDATGLSTSNEWCISKAAFEVTHAAFVLMLNCIDLITHVCVVTAGLCWVSSLSPHQPTQPGVCHQR
jgi:hypothetical protein